MLSSQRKKIVYTQDYLVLMEKPVEGKNILFTQIGTNLKATKIF